MIGAISPHTRTRTVALSDATTSGLFGRNLQLLLSPYGKVGKRIVGNVVSADTKEKDLEYSHSGTNQASQKFHRRVVKFLRIRIGLCVGTCSRNRK